LGLLESHDIFSDFYFLLLHALWRRGYHLLQSPLNSYTASQFVYAFQGQYTINPANQGLSPFGWQTATNIISLVASIIAAGLYGNIGIKVLYVHVLQELLGFPSLVSKAGSHIWIVAVIAYWSLAFVVSPEGNLCRSSYLTLY
jgi:hypothetical protein